MLVEQMRSLLKDKRYLFCLGLVLVLGYGFFFSYTSIYIDDTATGRYLAEGRYLRQGRWGLWLWTNFIHHTEFLPFVHKAGGVLVFLFSCVLICCLFQHISGNKISVKTLTIFSCLMFTYSLVNEILFYTSAQWQYSMLYLFTILSVWSLVSGKRVGNIIWATIFLTVAFSFTEAAAGVYIILVIGCMILVNYYRNDEMSKLLDYIKAGMICCGILILAIVIERIIALGFCALTGWDMQTRALLWTTQDFLYVLKTLIKTIFINYGIRAIFYFPIAEFLIAFVGNLCIVAWYAIKRDVVKSFLWAMFSLSSLIFSIMQGEASANRVIWQVFAIYIAFLCATFCENIYCKYNKRMISIVVSAIMSYIVVWQITDLNQWEYVNYMRNNEEIGVINDLGRELQREYDTENKPVVFVGTYQLSENILQYTHIKSGSDKEVLAQKVLELLPESWNYQKSYVNEYGYQFNETGANSVITWGIRAFSEPNTELLKIFAYNGFLFEQGTIAMYQEGLVSAQTMPEWPKEGSIKDVGEFILVNFGE